MRIPDLLKEIYSIYQEADNISEPFICGGIVRDRVIGDVKEKYKDLDVTTGDASISYLASEFFIRFSKQYNCSKKVGKDGHVSVKLSNFSIDFSSNFILRNIDDQLNKLGVRNATMLQKEMFSRDFTCNSLLLPFTLKNVIDPTGRGIKDIERKMIVTCCDVDSTFRYQPNRIPRVFYVAAKLGFDVDSNIIEWLKVNGEMIRNVEPGYTAEKLAKALSLDKERTARLLTETGINKYIGKS